MGLFGIITRMALAVKSKCQNDIDIAMITEVKILAFARRLIVESIAALFAFKRHCSKIKHFIG